LKRMGPSIFAGQYEQWPTPEQGGLFEAHMFCQDEEGKVFWPMPTSRVVDAVFSFDTALKTGSHNDFTAGCMILHCEDGHLYLYPLLLERLRVPEIEKRILRLWAFWSRQYKGALRGCLIEEGAGTALIQYLDIHNFLRKKATPPSSLWNQSEWDSQRSAMPMKVMPYTPQGDKRERACSVVPMAANGVVRLVDTHLSAIWLEQLKLFSNGPHDDAVDATVAGLQHFLRSPNSFLAGAEGFAIEEEFGGFSD